MGSNTHNQSALTDVLLALVPYSRQNIQFTFKPNQFFNQLEKSSSYKKHTLQTTYYRAKRRGLIAKDQPQLTRRGLREVQPFLAKRLASGSFLMVIFDIPEDLSAARTSLRRLLKVWGFSLVQKSVWASDMDYAKSLIDYVEDLQLTEFVQIFESATIYPKQ